MSARPWAPCRGGRPRSGQVLAVIVLLLAFLGILTYGLHTTMLGFHAQAHRLSAAQAVESLALSGLASGAARLRGALAVGGELAGRLLSADGRPGPLPLEPGPELELLLRDYPGATVRVDATLGPGRTLGGGDPAAPEEQARLRAGRGHDPVEQRLPVTFTARAAWGPVERTLTCVRELAVVHLSPGTLGKFTLWAKELRPANASGFACGFDGFPVPVDPDDTRSVRRPFLLHNGGVAPDEPFDRGPESFRRRGYVFLDGDVRLKLSSGYLGYGELWSFLPMEEAASLAAGLSSGPGLPVYADSDPPDPFLRSYPPPDRPPPPFQRFELRHMVAGFYSGPDERGRTLAELFPLQAAAGLGLSSLLHLYGTGESPSPTLVLGQVHRVYPVVSGILVDADEDGVMDGLVSLMPQAGEQSIPAGLPPIPAAVTGLPSGSMPGRSIAIDNEAEITWENLFEEGLYPTFASQVADRPYVDGYDFMCRSDDSAESFAPRTPRFGGCQESFDLELTPGERFFEGEARKLQAADLLEKATHRVGTQGELAGRFLTVPAAGGRAELALGCVLEVERAEGGVLRLEHVTVTRGGVLVLSGPGDLELLDVKFARELDFPLVVVALQGDVRLEPEDRALDPMPLAIVAQRGRLTVVGERATEPLALEGSLVLGTLDLDALASGGNLYHDRRLDPTDRSRADHYRLLLSDASLRW